MGKFDQLLTDICDVSKKIILLITIGCGIAMATYQIYIAISNALCSWLLKR